MRETIVQDQGSFLNGKFVSVKTRDQEITRANPGNTTEVVGVFGVEFAHVEVAVSFAKKAQKGWAALPIEERISYLSQLKKILSDRKEELSKLISREVGKPLWEARSEVSSILSKFDITISESLPLIQPFEIPNILGKKIGRCSFHPRGVAAVLGPFNFPAHLPFGHIIPALLTGNTIVFKPSELTPAVGAFLAACVNQAKFPAGVFNMVQGGGEVGARLVQHGDVDLVLFTGSYETGRKILSLTADQYNKLCALEMGGKNAAILFADADLKHAIIENLKGAYLTAGQRCTSTSRILVERPILEKFMGLFHEGAKRLSVGYPLGEEVFMGPLISESARERYIRFQGIAVRGGAEQIMRGKELEREYPGYYVSPSIHYVKNMNPEDVYQSSEIFAPNVAIFAFDTIEEAIQIANSTPYGLAMSVFTKKEERFKRIFEEGKTGLVNWNTMTSGASPRLPFGGIKKSGNGFPTALFSVYYCTYPVASLLEKGEEPAILPPGMDEDFLEENK